MEASVYNRQFYNPCQPTVGQSGDDVTYSEFPPQTKLQHIIYCYWNLKTDRVLAEEFNYRVVADGCIDVFFDLNNPSDSYVMGFCRKFKEFPLGNSFNYFGIRFSPSMFPLLFKVNAKKLSNKCERLATIVPLTADLMVNNLEAGGNSLEIISFFNNYFLKLDSCTAFKSDERLEKAIKIIFEKRGNIDVENDLAVGISSRQLRRIFEYYIGDSPKNFAQVVRFQSVLKAKSLPQSFKNNKLFFDAGYYDQAHFIKEFKNFYGVTPNRVFR